MESTLSLYSVSRKDVHTFRKYDLFRNLKVKSPPILRQVHDYKWSYDR